MVSSPRPDGAFSAIPDSYLAAQDLFQQITAAHEEGGDYGLEPHGTCLPAANSPALADSSILPV